MIIEFVLSSCAARVVLLPSPLPKVARGSTNSYDPAKCNVVVLPVSAAAEESGEKNGIGLLSVRTRFEI